VAGPDRGFPTAAAAGSRAGPSWLGTAVRVRFGGFGGFGWCRRGAGRAGRSGARGSWCSGCGRPSVAFAWCGFGAGRRARVVFAGSARVGLLASAVPAGLRSCVVLLLWGRAWPQSGRELFRCRPGFPGVLSPFPARCCWRLWRPRVLLSAGTGRSVCFGARLPSSRGVALAAARGLESGFGRPAALVPPRRAWALPPCAGFPRADVPWLGAGAGCVPCVLAVANFGAAPRLRVLRGWVVAFSGSLWLAVGLRFAVALGSLQLALPLAACRLPLRAAAALVAGAYLLSGGPWSLRLFL